MSKRIEIQPGARFGRLSYLRDSSRRSGRMRAAEFLCDCGAMKVIRVAHVRGGRIVSCGCFLQAVRPSLQLDHGHARRGRETPEYRVWESMISRCEDESSTPYRYYGALGIRVCKEWRGSFPRFLQDMGPRPSPNHSIDRFPDNSGHYEPDNCRWADRTAQCRNRSITRCLTLEGQTKSLAEWAELIGIRRGTLRARIVKGWPVEKALRTPLLR